MLNTSEANLRDIVHIIDRYEGFELNDLDDSALFNLIKRRLYDDDDRTAQEIDEDADIYSRYNFLNDAGESFDSHMSFMVKCNDVLRILFMDRNHNFNSFHIGAEYFIKVINECLEWIDDIRSS